MQRQIQFTSKHDDCYLVEYEVTNFKSSRYLPMILVTYLALMLGLTVIQI